jgi:hypothetical protein
MTGPRWTLNTAWYLFLPIMEKKVREGIMRKVVSREHFKITLSNICKAVGIKREDIGIIAGARAELYFHGSWSSVSFDSIDALAEKGTDILFIEKEGVPEILAEFADKYGIAMVNTKGHLTEYGKDLMNAARDSGANVAIITDYDLTGILIASKAPRDMPWLGIDDTVLEYFNLDRNDEGITAEATNTKILNFVKGVVSSDDRFGAVDTGFLETTRIEIDAILAQVGAERFSNWIMERLKELYPTRNYNRAIELPAKYSEERNNLLPEDAKVLIEHIYETANTATEQTEKDIETEQENIEGFIEVAERKDKNIERLTEAIKNDSNMKPLNVEIAKVVTSLGLKLGGKDKRTRGKPKSI